MYQLVGVLVGDAPEEVAGARAAQVLQRLRDRDLDVLRVISSAAAAGSTRSNRPIIASRQRRANVRWSRSAASSGNRSACTGSVDSSVGRRRDRRRVDTDHYARPMENEDIVETAASADDDDAVIEEELLIEEISIDGMCGVY